MPVESLSHSSCSEILYCSILFFPRKIHLHLSQLWVITWSFGCPLVREDFNVWVDPKSSFIPFLEVDILYSREYFLIKFRFFFLFFFFSFAKRIKSFPKKSRLINLSLFFRQVTPTLITITTLSEFAVFRGRCKDSPEGKWTQIYPHVKKGLKMSLRSSGTIPGLLKSFLSHMWAGGSSSATPPILPLLTEFI